MADEEQVTLLKLGAKVWNEWREERPTAEIDLRYANLSFADLSCADLYGVNLRGAILFEADLSEANLCNAFLSEAVLICTNFHKADLRRADLSYSDLFGSDLSEANLERADFRYASLREANFDSANLCHATLQAAQALGTDFKRARFTGVCIQDWQLGNRTNLQEIECDYIFRTYDLETEKFAGRLPVDPNRSFVPSEFEQWVQVRKGALDTIDITFSNGIDWQKFFQSLQITRQQHPDANVVVKSIEEESGIFVARLKIETDVSGEAREKLKAEIETQIKASYELQLAEAQGEIRGLYRSLETALKELAMASKYQIDNFNGNLADVNFGEMTAHIHQNNDAISQLIESLRTSAQSFPSEQKEEALMELDDLKEDLGKPEKQSPKRIGKRLQRLIAAGTAATAIAGGAATFAGNVNEFTENVIELGEKVGLSRENILGNQDHP